MGRMQPTRTNLHPPLAAYFQTRYSLLPKGLTKMDQPHQFAVIRSVQSPSNLIVLFADEPKLVVPAAHVPALVKLLTDLTPLGQGTDRLEPAN